MQQRGRFRGHCLVRFAFLSLCEIERDEAGAHRRLGLERRFARLAGERFELFQGIALAPGREKNRTGRKSRIVAERIRILNLDDLLINRARFILAIEILQTTRFEIARGKRQRGRFHLRGRAMKKREGRSVVLLVKGNFREAVRGRPGQLARRGNPAEHFESWSVRQPCG